MREAWAQYLASLGVEAPSTQQCRRAWAALFSERFEGRALHELTQADLDASLQWLLWTPSRSGKLRSPSTVYQGMAMFRQFLRWAAHQGLLEEDITHGWTMGRPTFREKLILSRSQVDAVLNAPPSTPTGLRDRAILHAIAELGLYGNACHALNMGDLDLAAYQLSGLRLGAHLAECLHRYVRHGRPALLAAPTETALFLGRTGQRLGPESIDAILLRHHPAQRISPRVLRRSWLAHRDAFVNRRLPES